MLLLAAWNFLQVTIGSSFWITTTHCFSLSYISLIPVYDNTMFIFLYLLECNFNVIYTVLIFLPPFPTHMTEFDKLTQYCKANILQLKINKLKNIVIELGNKKKLHA